MWSPIPLPICASHFRSLWNDSFRDVEHFDRFLIDSYVEIWFRFTLKGAQDDPPPMS